MLQEKSFGALQHSLGIGCQELYRKVSTQTIQLANSTVAHSKDRPPAVPVSEEDAGRGWWQAWVQKRLTNCTSCPFLLPPLPWATAGNVGKRENEGIAGSQESIGSTGSRIKSSTIHEKYRASWAIRSRSTDTLIIGYSELNSDWIGEVE
jgi:hypothetical protein